MEKVYLAGGCFWCMEDAFLGITGISNLIVGYIEKNEVIEITFDPAVVTFLQLLDIYWLHIDPFDSRGQFADRGDAYRIAIYVTSSRQKQQALASVKAIESLLGQDVSVQVKEARAFQMADLHHQSYCLKQPDSFRQYRSGHLEPLVKIWSGIERDVYQTLLEDKLTALQWHVTQQAGTEPPFKNLYWDHKQEGVYLDIITRDPLFSSEDKYDSGTGWPSFTKPLTKLIERTDQEVISPYSQAHLGHVFADGPQNLGGFRYCINSAALFFYPKNLSS